MASETDYLGGAALSNSIQSNAGLGIDIGDNGLSPDSSVVAASRRPTLTSVANTDAGTVITGTIPNHNSSNPYTLQFFSNPACDPSGHGEGQTFIGQTTFTPATQNMPVNFSHTISPAVPGGTSITAVALRQADGQQPGVFYSSEFSNCAPLAAPTPTPTPTPTPLQLFAIAPIRGGDNGEVTTRISGQGFQTGAIVKLTRAGQPDIVGSLVSLSEQGRVLNATFDLNGRARGLWSVVVTNLGGMSATLANAFNVEAGRAPQVWVDIVGRSVVRLGSTVTYTALVGNRGNTNAYGVPVWIAGIPKDAKVKLGFNLGQVPMPVRDGGAPAVDPNQINPVIKTATEQMLPLLMPVVPAGGVKVLQFSIEVPTVQPNFTLRAWTSPPLVKSVAGTLPPGTKDSFGLAHPYGDNIVTSDAGITCLNALFQAAVSCALSFVPGQNCLKAVLGYTSNTIGSNQGSTDALSMSQFLGGAVQVANCLVSEAPGLSQVLDIIVALRPFTAHRRPAATPSRRSTRSVPSPPLIRTIRSDHSARAALPTISPARSLCATPSSSRTNRTQARPRRRCAS